MNYRHRRREEFQAKGIVNILNKNHERKFLKSTGKDTHLGRKGPQIIKKTGTENKSTIYYS